MRLRKTAVILFILPILLFAATAFAASEGSSDTWSSWKLLWRVINTVALVALLVYFLKKPMANFFAERKAQIQKDLEEAKEQRDKAERLIGEYQQKIAGMERELESMRAELRKAADVESGKVMANAERMAAGMVESARIAAEQEVRKAKIALKNEAVTLAVELAESLIREKITDDDRKRIVEDYFVKVGGIK